MADEVVGFERVLKDELQQLRIRRAHVFSVLREDDRSGDAQAQSHRFRPLGFAVSGGGIRSATFNLGIIQGLASRGLLPYVDYLSTVSGGGYIGTWLHGVIRRKDQGDPTATAARLDPEQNPIPGSAEKDPITFLRKYSNYLAPRTGLFTADTWLIASIWLRNMLLNQLILIPLLAAVVLLALLTGAAIRPVPHDWVSNAAGIVAFASLLIAVINAGWFNLRAIAKDIFRDDAAPKSPQRGQAWPTIAGVLVASLAVFCLHWEPMDYDLFGLPNWLIVAISLEGLFLTLQLLGGFPQCFENLHPERKSLWMAHAFWMPLVASAVTALMLCGVMHAIASFKEAWHAVVWGPPAILAVFLAGESLHIGLMGADFPDASREWLARVGAVVSMVATAWLVILALAVYGPYWIALLGFRQGGAAVAAIMAWAGSTLTGVRAGTSPRTSGVSDDPKQSSALEWITNIAPTVFMIGLLILIAAACHYALGALAKDVCMNEPLAGGLGKFDRWFQWLGPFEANYFCVLYDGDTWPNAWFIFLGCAAAALLLPLRFNINEFSLHHFYKNRLVRCYEGAGNAEDRNPNPFTGFDSHDDFAIASLVPTDKNPYYGPYAVVNTALNLNAGTELAQQERKSTSFVFTPLYSGFDPPHSKADLAEVKKPGSRLAADGYRATRGYFDPSGPYIGTAMAISGAAANPNWGYHTSAPVAFLLTIFNVRLGWWVGNPRITCKGSLMEGFCPSKRSGPMYGLSWLIWELLGQTTGRSKYVNLSDGGHFENLGLYELVRRRCRYIIVGDGEQDGKLAFESLGGAIRKCRADFGVEIDIDIEQIRNPNTSQRTHCVVGTVIYPEREKGARFQITKDSGPCLDARARGWILYFKSSLTGDEPEDVKQYHDSHTEFPHESTVDQFFSESQFESYRRLGLHVVESAFENVASITPPTSPGGIAANLDDCFKQLAALWYAPSNLAVGVATRHAEVYSELIRLLGKDPDLGFLDAEVVIGMSSPPPKPLDKAAERKAHFFVIEPIQLMENVWADFKLEASLNRNNPRNAGWLAVFRHWAGSNFFAETWKQVENNYNPLFAHFLKTMIDEVEKNRRSQKPDQPTIL